MSQTTLEYILLPHGVSFSVFDDVSDGSYYPKIEDLAWAIPVALILTLIRKYLVEKPIARSIGMHFGLKHVKPKAPTQHPLLLRAFKLSPKAVPNEKIMKTLERDTKMEYREIERWWKQQRAYITPCTLTKFEETFWRALFYTLSFLGGCYVCLSEPYFWDTDLFWVKNPRHPVSSAMYWYYTIELGLYLSLVVSQFTDIRRKDFLQMFIHHVVTIALIVLSWWANMVRIGSIVFLYHDVADIFLECAKLMKYIKFENTSTFFFVNFAIIFIVSRLVLYPAHLVWDTFANAPLFLDANFPGAVFFRFLLLALLPLHLIWALTIVRMAIRLLGTGQLDNDHRSDDDD